MNVAEPASSSLMATVPALQVSGPFAVVAVNAACEAVNTSAELATRVPGAAPQRSTEATVGIAVASACDVLTRSPGPVVSPNDRQGEEPS